MTELKPSLSFFCPKCRKSQNSRVYWFIKNNKPRMWCKYCGKVLGPLIQEAKPKPQIKHKTPEEKRKYFRDYYHANKHRWKKR